MIQLIDSHCHLESFVKSGELDAVLERARAAGVCKLIAVGTDVKDWGLYAQLAERYVGEVFYTVGLHPCHVEEDWAEQLERLPVFFEAGAGVRPVALGEIGLDYFHLPKDADQAAQRVSWQKAALAQQLETARGLGCPVVIHSRGAFEDTVAMIEASGVEWRKVVFHCFSEGAEQMAVLDERGGRGSFTGIATYKNAQSVRDALKAQGMDKLMLETDAPYLAPVPHRGKPNEPAFVVHIAQACADYLGLNREAFAAQVFANTEAFFGL